MSKIFCIGANKTGTTSLKIFLKSLGYKLCPEEIMFANTSNYFKEFAEGEYEGLLNLVNKYDAFEDRPWNHTNFYKVLDAKFPGSKFILTTRDVNDWWESYQRWNRAIDLRKRKFYKTISNTCYGVDSFLDHPELVKEMYILRNEEVKDYFAGSSRFVELPIEHKNKSEILCEFLEKTKVIPKFSHVNKTK